MKSNVPDWKQEIRRRLVNLKLGPAREVSVVEELAGHLEDYYEELVAGGATKAEAERRTLAELSESGILARELMRMERRAAPEPIVPGTIRRTNMLADIWQDMRYGMRTLLKSPGFTLVAVLTLALGIGANTAIFTLIDAVLLKTLPVKDPEQLVVLGSTSGFGGNSFSYPMFQDLRNRNQVFTEIFAYQGVILNLSEGALTERVSGQLVSGNFFVGLGVSALLGRVFDDADDQVPSAHPVVLLGHHFWTRRFAGDQGLVGKTIHLNGYPFTVIGILPAGFFGVEVGASPEVWVPRMMQPQLSAGNDRLRMRNNFGVKIMARLEPDVSMEQAQAATDLLSQQINSEAQDLREPLRGFLLKQHIELQPASKATSFYEHLLERVRALHGVQSASLADSPLLGGAWITGVTVEGYQPSPGEDTSITAKRVQPQFFATMGIPVLIGRDFAREDGPNAPKVAIVNQTLAHAFWGNENPIGRRIGVDDKPDCEVIGVIKDTRYRDLKEQQQRTVYLPFTQVETRSLEGTVHIRTSGDATRLMDEIRQAVQALDKNLPVYNVRTFPELVEESVSQERVIAMLASFFGLLALLLASIGLYGVIAYGVARRTHEIGIRVALGARAGDVLKLVIKQGMTLASLGIMIGLAAAIGLTRFLKALLFGVNATDPLTFIVIALLLTSIALLASWIPARRATKVDPMMALRHE